MHPREVNNSSSIVKGSGRLSVAKRRRAGLTS